MPAQSTVAPLRDRTLESFLNLPTGATMQQPPSNKKRDLATAQLLSDDHAHDNIPDDEYEDGQERDPAYDCAKMRARLRALIDGGEVKVTHWQREQGVNSKSYGDFMKYTGAWGGIDNVTYRAAYAFFKKRDRLGVKPGAASTAAAAKKRKSNDGAAAATTGTGKGKAKSKAPDLSGVHLPGEETNSVEVYDSPAEIRRKISAYLPKEGITLAAFCRAVGEQYHPARTFQGAQLARFRSKKTPDGGNSNGIFYGAYVFFEKLRVKEGKPKSKFRLEMENEWAGEGGFYTDRGGPSERG